MSSTRKKPDFNKLDFSKVTVSADHLVGKIPAPIEGLDPTSSPPIVDTPKKRAVLEGTWIAGKNNADITPEEFKTWLSDLFPFIGVDKWEDEVIATPKAREKIIMRLGRTIPQMFGFPQRSVEEKHLVN